MTPRLPRSQIALEQNRFNEPPVPKRAETVGNTCNVHLGHVFPDGPAPSRLRYCMNAVALRKVAKT